MMNCHVASSLIFLFYLYLSFFSCLSFSYLSSSCGNLNGIRFSLFVEFVESIQFLFILPWVIVFQEGGLRLILRQVFLFSASC